MICFVILGPSFLVVGAGLRPALRNAYILIISQKRVKESLSKLIHVPFKLESLGSQIIFFDPEEDYSVEEMARENQSPRIFHELTSLEEPARNFLPKLD